MNIERRLRLGQHSPVVRYLLASRSTVYSAFFALPLFLAYECAAILYRQDIDDIRNGADVLLKQVLVFLGVGGFMGVSVILLGALLYLIWKERRRTSGPIRGGYFLLMAGESVVYALGLGRVVSRMVQAVMIGPVTLSFKAQVIASLGAGIYEELLFRVFLITALYIVLHRLFGLRLVSAYLMAAVMASLIFSGFHYVGPLGDRFTIHSFVFRFFAGLVLSALYITRGYGITAYTHTMYDLFITFKL
ncbi:MAG: CPBP family intramembrane metalloprotease [Candidatus Latescibacteria bacterium]|nr:CPBP family intramembrane metalloprotease [Candidatus Latescibacterota bacterium]